MSILDASNSLTLAGQDSSCSGGINGLSVPLPSNAAHKILERNASQDLNNAGKKLVVNAPYHEKGIISHSHCPSIV